MQKVILEDHPQAEIAIFVVWLKMYDADSLDVVKVATRLFSDDPRVTQFYDQEKLSGLEVAAGLGGKSRDIAWDVYLFFAGQDEWIDRPPQPLDWVHQLRGSSWAEPERLFQGEQLTLKLREIMANLFQNEVDE